MEILLRGLRLVELRLPVALEVDGVGEHQARGRRHCAAWQQVLDLVRGLLGDPLVDGQAHGFGRALEIHLAEARAIVGLGEFQEIGKKALVLLGPECVGHAQLVARMWRVHVAEQRAHGRVKPVRRQREVERGRHLLGGTAAGPGIGHSESRGDACGREEEISVLLAQLAVEIDGEGVVAFDEFCLIGCGRWSRLRHGSLLQEQKRNKHEKQRFHGILQPRTAGNQHRQEERPA